MNPETSSAKALNLYKEGVDLAHELSEQFVNTDTPLSMENFNALLNLSIQMQDVAGNGLLALVLSDYPERLPILAVKSVNAAILAQQISRDIKFIKLSEITNAFIAAFLMDVGLRLNTGKRTDIFNSTGGRDEFVDLINAHPKWSARFISESPFISKQYPEDGAEIDRAIFQHHERLQGQGYPKKLSGENIRRLGKILAVADTFEAMCHYRPYQITDSQGQNLARPTTTYQALQEIVAMKATYFDPEILRSLVNILTFFPIGSFVKLNTGEIGIVINISRVGTMRPTVKILFDSEGHALDSPKIVNLLEEPQLYVLTPAEQTDELSKFRLKVVF